MGLGKTLQAISFLSYLKFHRNLPGPFLVLCPLSVTDNWLSEITKFTPNLKVLSYVGDKEHRRNLRMAMCTHIKENSSSTNVPLLPFDVLLTTYDIALMDQDFLCQIPWQYAIIDEAQRLKNPSSVLYDVLSKRFLIPRRLLMTGTPIQNNLTELWALMHFCMPSVFGSLEQFLYTFREAENTSSGYHQLAVMQLRKLCSHPYLFPGIEPEPYVEGEHLIQASGKLIILDQLLQELHESGHRVLLFAQMTHTLDILQDYMELRKYSYERLDGSIRAEERFAAIRSFSGQSGKRKLDSEVVQSGAFVFLISTRAGGVGLNLVAADTVIFFEQDWNPQVDKQALQRAHRIGQMNHVLAINLVTGHSVEEIIMRRAERKLQLSHNVVGDTVSENEGKESGIETGDLRSIIFGLHIFDPTETSSDELDDSKLSELNAITEKVLAIRKGNLSSKGDEKFEINSKDFLDGGDIVMRGATDFDPGLDEVSYRSWVEKFKEVSQSEGNSVLELGSSRRNLLEDKHVKLEAARKKAEEKKLAKWEANGYHSLAVEGPTSPVESNTDIMSDSGSGSVNFVYGDCTQPSKICPSEPAIIFSCVDDSGKWGHGGMFDALAKLSSSIPEAYERSSEFGDLHLGDLHLIKTNGDSEEQIKDRDSPIWVALGVVQSYNPRRKVPRSDISASDLEHCLSKVSFSASQNSGIIIADHLKVTGLSLEPFQVHCLVNLQR
ncbi:hypothetical protein ACFE04_018456 [Oxalis oulophora]